jgi:beta-glucosidase
MKKNIVLCFCFVLIVLLNLHAEPDIKNPSYPDKKIPVEKRIKDLLGRMTLEEKIAQMCQYRGINKMKKNEGNHTPEEVRANDNIGMYPGIHSSDVIKMIEEGMIGSLLQVYTAEESNYLQELAQKSRLQIPLLIGTDAIHGNGLTEGATVYPTPIGLASTWNPELLEKIARQTAAEMLAEGLRWTFYPNVDVARDARWGRTGETFGEDPYLVSVMGSAAVKGFQQEDMYGNLKILACTKHLVAGSEPINGLNASPTDVSERTLREIFLPPYRAAVDAGVFTVMAAHNELNGIPCHADKWLLTDILRKEMGFSGFIVSDWMDIEEIWYKHKVSENQKEACFLTIGAGMDMHMHGPNFLEPVAELVREGRISEERIDESVKRILEAKFRLGLFEEQFVDIKNKETIIFNKEHQATALRAARESIVLLKNNGLLPLDTEKYQKIFVTGPNADNETILGDWVFDQIDDNVITIIEGLRQTAPEGCEIQYFDCGDNLRRIEDAKIKEAGRRVKNADLAVVVVGENSLRYIGREKTCGESMDRADLRLGGKQFELVKTLYDSGRPLIVVLVNGRPLGTTWIAEHVPALIEAWEPGCFGGQAVAEILFGDVNPGGKLPITIPRSAGQIQMVYNHKPSHYSSRYAFEKKAPLYPFGYGLSYTQFEYSSIDLKKTPISGNQNVKVSIDVKNTGQRTGDEIVQLYIRDLISSATRPVKELKDFKRITLKSGETKTVTFEITPDKLAFYDAAMNYGVEPGTFKIMIGSSSRDEDLKEVMLEVD